MLCLRKSLLKSVKDMNAYLWVTDEVLHQIRRLPSKKGKGEKDIDEAKGILNRIHRRDFYRLVGENKMSWRGRITKEVHYNPHVFVVNVIATKTETIFSKIPYCIMCFHLR